MMRSWFFLTIMTVVLASCRTTKHAESIDSTSVNLTAQHDSMRIAHLEQTSWSLRSADFEGFQMWVKPHQEFIDSMAKYSPEAKVIFDSLYRNIPATRHSMLLIKADKASFKNEEATNATSSDITHIQDSTNKAIQHVSQSNKDTAKVPFQWTLFMWLLLIAAIAVIFVIIKMKS